MTQVCAGVPVQVAEQNLHGVLVGAWQLLDQLLHRLHLLLVVADFCSKEAAGGKSRSWLLLRCSSMC